ncbi:MAG: alpha-L-rhamnosidase [Fimbriimonas sp.]
MRVPSQPHPFAYPDSVWQAGHWPARWVDLQERGDAEPRVMAFRRTVKVDTEQKLRFHVSADQRYELYLDGVRIGRGSERGDRTHWFYETYEVTLTPGEHVFVARTWWLSVTETQPGPAAGGSQEEPAYAPFAQMTVRPAFFFAAEGDLAAQLTTGIATWEVKRLGGYQWLGRDQAWGCGAKVHIVGSKFDWGFEKGLGTGWQPAVVVGPVFDQNSRDQHRIWVVEPGTLPAMQEERKIVGRVRAVDDANLGNSRTQVVKLSNPVADAEPAWESFLTGTPVTVAPRTSRRVLIDLEDYYCAYPELTVSQGAGSKIRVHWAESLFARAPGKGEWIGAMAKGNRNEVDGRVFWGVGDQFDPDGGEHRTYETLWWEAGRFVEITIETGDQPLVLESFAVRDTHYPYRFEGTFTSSDPRLEEVIPIGKRVLQMCSHETYMDCPYYEQLMYVGDTRLEVLTSYAWTKDDRLPRKAIRMFDLSRIPEGLTHSRYPTNVTQFIPPFSLWWTGMVYDFALWRGDRAFVKDRMQGVRAVLDYFRPLVNEDHLLVSPFGWNYFDWIGDLPESPPGTVHGLYNLQFVLALRYAEALEQWLGEEEMALRHGRLADKVFRSFKAAFWSSERGLFADDLAKTKFSEHVQALSLIADDFGRADGPSIGHDMEAFLGDHSLTRTTIYFSHYLFEAYRLLGRTDKLVERMELWFGLVQNGLKTTIEAPEPTRSDCHAWGAHPLFHYLTTILGIRPASFGFETVRVDPQLGPLEWAHGKLAHPKGLIEVDVRHGDVHVVLPPGVTQVK